MGLVEPNSAEGRGVDNDVCVTSESADEELTRRTEDFRFKE
jgi:hypothetical protein